MSGKKPKIGDIYEIRTPAGLAYVQYTHQHPHMGQLVRVLPGLYQNRPDLKQLAQTKELYFVFYPVKYAIRDREAELVAQESVPEWARPFPMMRRQARDGWLIGDGLCQSTVDEIRRMTYVRELTPEQKKLAFGNLLRPHPVMVRELARGWTPEREEEFRLKDAAEFAAKKKTEVVQTQNKDEGPRSVIDHYLYFPKKPQAEEAARRLRAKGWQVEVRMGADAENWLALAKQLAPIHEEIGDVRDELEDLADELHGEYDGWGAPV